MNKNHLLCYFYMTRAHTIAFYYHLSDVMSNNYCSELCIYKSLSSVAEPLEVIVVLDLTVHILGFNRFPASMHRPFFTGQQLSGHGTKFILEMVDLDDLRHVMKALYMFLFSTWLYFYT